MTDQTQTGANRANEPFADNSVKNKVNSQFSQTAALYRTSRVHAQGEEFARLLQAAGFQGHETVVDAGCGAGHTAAHIAPHVGQVLAVDLSSAMLTEAESLCREQGLSNVTFVQGDVETLDDAIRQAPIGRIDAIVSRFSAHHWPDPARALRSFRRTLKYQEQTKQPGRVFLIDVMSLDSYVYDTHLQAIELLRDPSHIRDHSLTQWQHTFEQAGFQAHGLFEWDLTIEFEDWVTRMQTPQPEIQAIRRLFSSAPDEVKARFHLNPDQDTFTLACALIQAVAV